MLAETPSALTHLEGSSSGETYDADQLMLEVTQERMKSGIGKFSCKALVAGELAAEANITCAMRRFA